MTPSGGRFESFSPKPEVAVCNNTKENLVSYKSTSAKRKPSKQENVNINSASNVKTKTHLSEEVLWSSLPSNLLKPGKVSLSILIINK